MPGVCPGGGGMLKFRFDRRIKLSNDLVDLANVTQASRVIRGSDEARARC